MSISSIVILVLYVFQLISLIAVVFIERKDPVTTLSWVFILTFLPIIGFILYLFLGRGLTALSGKKLKLLHDLQTELSAAPPRAAEYYADTLRLLKGQKISFSNAETDQYSDLIRMNFKLSQAPYTQNNDLKIYVDAKEKYKDLFQDIQQATQTIHLCYFIVSNTEISHELIQLLAQKAREGVQVRFIFDEMGNFFVSNKIFDPLREAGGEVYGFFPLSFRNILHANYRNHHKIVVIDGVIGYTGGMNIGDEYMGLHPRKTPWRDTHMRMTGDSVANLQFLFIMDLYYATNNREYIENFFNHVCFPPPMERGHLGMQIVSSGPDDESEAIKRAFVKLIYEAKESLYIQTPYLMPDQPVMEALQSAASSGVDVHLMLPGVPDKKLVYTVTISYIRDMLDYGINVYIYNGFLHSKMIVIDDKVTTMGTTNLDMRSFNLHFELNNFIYDSNVSTQCREIFEQDLQNCYKMTEEKYESRSAIRRFFERVFRLFAPLM